MRTMLKISMPVDTANRAIKDGSLARTIENAAAALKSPAVSF